MTISAKIAVVVVASALGPTLCPSQHEVESNSMSESGSSSGDAGTSGTMMPTSGATNHGGPTGTGTGTGTETETETGGTSQGLPSTWGVDAEPMPDDTGMLTSDTLDETTSSSSSTGSTTGDTSSTSVCGNGYQEFNEECDDCNMLAEDHDCSESTCFYENCTGDEDSGKCDKCTPATCGDGMKNAPNHEPEECDDKNEDDGDTCSGECKRESVAFVTSGVYYGNMKKTLSIFDYSATGLAAADAICQGAANSFLPDGQKDTKFRAWMTNEPYLGGPPFWFEGKDMTNEKIVLRNGEILADGWAQLASGTLKQPLDITENKKYWSEAVDDTKLIHQVWTDVGHDGKLGPSSCFGWNVGSAGEGGIGSAASADFNWTMTGEQACDQLARLYCFSQ